MLDELPSVQRGSTPVWLDLSFDDPAFEAEVARFVLRRLGSRYARLTGITLEDCC